MLRNANNMPLRLLIKTEPPSFFRCPGLNQTAVVPVNRGSESDNRLSVSVRFHHSYGWSVFRFHIADEQHLLTHPTTPIGYSKPL